MCLAASSQLSGLPLKLKETNISNKHNTVYMSYWREADQLAIHKHDWGHKLMYTILNLAPQSGV